MYTLKAYSEHCWLNAVSLSEPYVIEVLFYGYYSHDGDVALILTVVQLLSAQPSFAITDNITLVRGAIPLMIYIHFDPCRAVGGHLMYG